MNYEELLRKYIEHVRQAEGIDFLDRLNNHTASDVVFSVDDVSALLCIASPRDGDRYIIKGHDPRCEIPMPGCRKPLEKGQWFNFCGETDMGQAAPALCTECGGEFKLHEIRQARRSRLAGSTTQSLPLSGQA